jgi:hypothetical protein
VAQDGGGEGADRGRELRGRTQYFRGRWQAWALSLWAAHVWRHKFARQPDANSATKRMLPIKNHARNGPVGVLKPRCTIELVGTPPHRLYQPDRDGPKSSLTLSIFRGDQYWTNRQNRQACYSRSRGGFPHRG